MVIQRHRCIAWEFDLLVLGREHDPFLISLRPTNLLLVFIVLGARTYTAGFSFSSFINAAIAIMFLSRGPLGTSDASVHFEQLIPAEHIYGQWDRYTCRSDTNVANSSAPYQELCVLFGLNV
jgi:hypothetical protein